MADTFAPRDPRPALLDLLRNYSAEVTSGDRRSIDVAISSMQPGAEVFIASLPADSAARQLLAAVQLKRGGLTPVPHLVARNIKNLGELDAIVERLVGEAGVDRALILAGDRNQPAGDFSSSLQLLETGMLTKHGVRRVALSSYPEGHPRIRPSDLSTARAAKVATARKAGLDVTLVSQFCFEPGPIVQMARQIRSEGLTVPLRVGVAGPTSRASLLKYAMMCGVGASVRALKERPATRNILADNTPEDVLSEIARAQAADPKLGFQGVHFFTFAALAKTLQFVEECRRSD